MPVWIMNNKKLGGWLKDAGLKKLALAPGFAFGNNLFENAKTEVLRQHPEETDPDSRAAYRLLARNKPKPPPAAIVYRPDISKWVRIGFGILVLGLLSVLAARSQTVIFKDEGVNRVRRSGGQVGVDFVGAGVSCAPNVVGIVTCTISGGGATGYQTIEDEGVPLTQRTVLNFVGSGVSCADDIPGLETDCTITAGAGATHQIDAVALTAQDPINFLDTSVFDWTNPAAGNLSLAIKAASLADSLMASSYGGVGACGANTFETADNDDAAPTCTTAVLASAQFANQGTNIQVLHGNAAGNPSWGQVLPADIGDGGVAATFAFFSGAAGDPSFRAIVDGDLPPGLTRDTESPNAAGDISGTYSAGLTIDAGAVASAELATANKTFDKSIDVIDPVTGDDDKIQWMHGKAVTYVGVDCSTDAGTVTIDMDHRVLTTPNTVGTDILTGTIVCDTDNQADGGFADATIPANVPVNLSITAVSGAGAVRIHIRGTID